MKELQEVDFQKLDNQLCFPLYAASRLITKCYQPLLKDFELTYPQYLVLMVLWEQDKVPLNYLSEKLYLQSNTLTPLVKRMEEMQLVTRQRSKEDERSVLISLTEKGQSLKCEAKEVPTQLVANFDKMTTEELKLLHQLLYKLIGNFEE
ncbi:DNA-binding transcriptional regulator, MarR family [Pustulibacterium marinum]|uniref:HTH-type transcriptional regulator SarZ n=1 Tax=Pustulibacterium marinum TaxID=1224947 RepID=A0A1I7H3H1_9FLAO|nr:MarR family transcriptional regulator [Pustulibacterium marinum]SFU55220.1 DNA-binding transcriptional regulator, MarR family [Pustulibacterium marinum]